MTLVDPIVPPASMLAPTLPTHLMGIGPWNTAVPWRGAPNHGVAAGRLASVPVINLPMADSKKVTLRLSEASEASTTHYFARNDAIVIEEMITDLWWRRRDPRRNVVDRIGRFNATTVDIDVEVGGGANVTATYTDYQGLLLDRMVMQYLTPGASPPTTTWAANTLVTDILRWAVPTNMGLDLTGIQAATPDITAKVKEAFYIPLGATIEQVMKNLQAVSDKVWEWWVDMPVSDTGRPRLTLATTRGQDRGVILFDIGGYGPIEKWTRQASADKYANALMFAGHDDASTGGGGSAVVTYPDQIDIYGQRDAAFSDDSVSTKVNGAGVPAALKAAAFTKLADLATPEPTYTVTLRQGFWEGRTHIDVGDYLGLRLALGQDVIAAKPRVTEIGLEIDGQGFETVTLTLGPPRPAKDPRSRVSAAAKLVRYLKKYTTPENAPAYTYTY